MYRSAGVMPQSLVEFLQSYLRQHNLSQNELGDKLGITSATMSNIMTGRTKHPRPEALARIADFTGIPYIQLCAMLDERLDNELATLTAAASETSRNAKIMLLAEELSKLPAETLDLFLSLARQYKTNTGGTKADK